MASSSNQTTDRRGRGATIWELGPVRSRMTQNALGDHFVDQFQDNSEKEPSTAFGDQETNVTRALMPTVKIEPENKSESSFGDYFKKTYTGSSNRITRTVTAIPVSAATRLTQGEPTGLGTTLNHQGELTGLGMYPWTLNPQGEMPGLGMYSGTMNHQENWKTRGMRGRWDPIEGIRPGSSASSSGMRGPTDLIQSRDDQFNFRMGLLERENLQPTSTLHQELEAQKRGEAKANKIMKLIQAEKLKQALVKQDPQTLNHHGETTGLRTTLNHQGELYGLGMYPWTLNPRGETPGLGMYSGTMNHQENWEMRGMRGRWDPMEGIRPGSSASSSGMRGPTDMIQSRDDQFNFRMGLLVRENLRISNPMSGIAGPMTLEEIERQMQNLHLQRWEQAHKMRQMMELEAQKRREAIEADEMMKMEAQKSREVIEADETMKLIQAEQLKQAMVMQDLAREAEENERGQQTLYGMAWHGGKSRQEDIDRLHKEVEMLKKQLSSKSPDNSALKSNTVPARSGVKSRLGVAARLGDPQESKKKVFERLGQDDEMKEHVVDMQQGNVERRWKRGNGDKDSTPKNQYRKKRKNGSHELPADLVLTELSDAGPVPAKPSEEISPELSRVITRELVLAEFGENGPVKVQTELKKLEARARKVFQTELEKLEARARKVSKNYFK